MDKNTIIGLLLIFSLVVGYSWWASPSAEERATIQKEQQEQLALARQEADSLATIREQNDSTRMVQAPIVADSAHIFAYALRGETEIKTFENDVFKVNFTNKGGRIQSIELKNYKTWKKQPLYLLDERFSEFYFTFFSNNRNIQTKDLYFTYVAPAANKVSGSDSLAVALRAYPQIAGKVDSSRYFEIIYTLHGDAYMLGMRLNFVGMNDLIMVPGNILNLTWNANLQRNEKAPALEDPNTAIYYKPTNDDVDYLKETGDDKENISTSLKWVSFKQQFFSSTLIMNQGGFANADIANFKDKKLADSKTYCKTLTSQIGIPYKPEERHTIDMSFYLGPNKFYTLRQYDLEMERLIPIGWSFFLLQWINRFAVIPLFTFLEKAHLSYGLIILILTVLLKLVLSPITYKSYISSAKMKIIKPEVDELAKKFPKPDQAMDKQRAMMTLYKKAGINQLAGCIPMLAQFPILIAMFRFFPASIELRQQGFLWADDLSSYDSIATLPFNIPFYGDHISLFALLMAISNLMYTRMTMKQNAAATTMPGMKVMMYIMPIMFLGILNSYSSALNYYYTLSTCMTFLITWVFGLLINEEKVHKMILESKKKPLKKSGFQQRIEKMAQQQQSNQQRKR